MIRGKKITFAKIALLKKPEPEEPVTPMSLDRPEVKEVRMHPQKSSYEERVINTLRIEGIPIETDIEFCAVSTVPDGVVQCKSGKTASMALIYLDGSAHEGRKDEDIRYLLQKHDPNLRVCSFRWKNDTVEETERVLAEIREAIFEKL